MVASKHSHSLSSALSRLQLVGCVGAISAAACVALVQCCPRARVTRRLGSSPAADRDPLLVASVNRSYDPLPTTEDDDGDAASSAASTQKLEMDRPQLSFRTPLLMQACLSLLENGALPALLPYVFEPYLGGREHLKLAIDISLLVDPLSCLLALRIGARRAWRGPGVAALVLGAALTAVAAVSPHPPFVGTTWAPVTLVVLAVTTRVLISLAKTLVYLDGPPVQQDVDASTGELRERARYMQQCGLMQQLGTGVGSFAFFVLVNELHLFHQ